VRRLSPAIAGVSTSSRGRRWSPRICPEDERNAERRRSERRL